MSARNHFRNRFPLALVALSGTVRGLMKRRARAGLGVLACLLLAMPALANDVAPGSDLLETPPGYTFDDLSGNPLPPPPETGACCFADGSCLIETAADCVTAGGTYQGDDTACDPNPCPQPGNVAPGSDLLETPPGYTFDIVDSNEPLPQDFFGSNSDPWSGIIALKGYPFPVPGPDPNETADTIVARLDWAYLPDPNSSEDTVPIQILALSLVSVAPITVTFQNCQGAPKPSHSEAPENQPP